MPYSLAADPPGGACEEADAATVTTPTPASMTIVEPFLEAIRPQLRVRHSCCRTRRRLRPLPAAPEGPGALVGHMVELFGLKSKPELNGRRGRVSGYNSETGRAAVLLKSIKAFGAVEKTALALQPANLRFVEDAPPAPSRSPIGVDHLTWTHLLEHAGLPHLKHLLWSVHEEAICDALMAKVRRAAGKEAIALCAAPSLNLLLRCCLSSITWRLQVPERGKALAELQRLGVHEEVDREDVVDALLQPASTIFPNCSSSASAVLKLAFARVSQKEREREREFDSQRAGEPIACSSSTALVYERRRKASIPV